MLALTVLKVGNKAKFTDFLRKHSCKHIISVSFVTDLPVVKLEIFLIHSELLSDRSLGFKDPPLISYVPNKKISDSKTASLSSHTTKLQRPS